MFLLPSAIGAIQQDPLRRIFKQASLDLQFAEKKSLVDATTGQNLVTFTRASSGTYVGSDGLIKTATTNEARFDHNPTTGESLGLLVEESRTNLVTNSTDVAAYFTEQNSTATANTAAAPDGTTTATLLIPNTTFGSHTSFGTSVAFSASTTYSYSVFVKPNGYTFLQLLFTSGFNNNLAWVNFNLTGAGSFGFTGGGEISKQIQAFPGGWYRCTMIATSGSSPFAGGPAYLVLDSDRNSRDANYAGNNTAGAYIWGAQLEAGAFPTSYIPTTSSTVTRAADVASISGSNFSSWYRQDEGTLYAEGSVPVGVSGARALAGISDGTATERILIGHNGTTTTNGLVVDDNVTQTTGFNGGSNSFPPGERRKLALAYKIDDFGFTTIPGTTVAQDSSGTLPTVDRLQIGNAPGRTEPNQPIRRLTYWPQRLPNETLQTITQ